LIDTALEYQELGLRPIPCDVRKDSCSVSAKWRDDCRDVEGWSDLFHRSNGIALKLGMASGGLMVADIDQKHDNTLTLSDRFMEALKFMLPDIWDDFYVEETRSGGLHLFFRVKGMDAPKKEIPASTLEFGADGKERKAALIEMLGEGQMVFTYPTPLYQIRQGSIEEIPTITEDQHREFLNVCRSFNELPDAEVEPVQADWGLSKDEGRPGDIYNRTCDPHKFAAWLQGKGWKIVKKMGDKYWFRRPAMDGEVLSDNKVSATWNHDGKKMFICFSDNAGIEARHPDGRLKGWTPFSIYATLQHNGNYRAAAGVLVEHGMVNPDHWDEVEPLEPVKAAPFNLDEVLPSSCSMFKRYIEEVAESFQVHPEMALLPAMSVASLAISSAARVRINEDWVEDAPIWSIVVANASERKSPVLKELMTPIEDYLARFKHENKRSISALKRRKNGLAAKLAKLEEDFEKAITKGAETSDLEFSITHAELELDEMPEIVDTPNLIQGDATVEALAHILKQNGETVGVISAEAEPINVALGLYSNKPNFSLYLKGFSVERYVSSRVGTGQIELEQPRIVLSVLMQSEPMEALAESRAARERGFIGRCFFAVPQSKVGARTLTPTPVSAESRSFWKNRINHLMSLPHRLRLMGDGEGGVCVHTKDPEDVSLSQEALALFMKAREENERALISGGDLDEESGWGGKLMGNICRVALTLHFLGGGSIREEITSETMMAAIAWVEPLTEHYYSATGHVGELQIDKVVYQIMKKIKDNGLNKNGARLVELAGTLRTRKLNTSKMFMPIFDRMQELGFIRMKDGEKPKSGPIPRVMDFHPNFVNLVK